MTPHNEAPALSAEAPRESLVGPSRNAFNLTAFRAQRIAARYALPIETAVILAALAFGGCGHA